MVVTAQITFTTDLRPKLLCWGLSIIVVLISVFLTLFAMHKETYKPSMNAEQDTSSWAFADEEQDTSSWVFADEEINIGPTITVSEFKWDCPPSPHVHATLSEQLWCENIDTVEKAFNTEFIQGASPFFGLHRKILCRRVVWHIAERRIRRDASSGRLLGDPHITHLDESLQKSQMLAGAEEILERLV